MPVSEITKRVSQDERNAWKVFYDLYGPLDWRRGDLLDARRIRYDLGVSDEPDETFLRFPEPRLKTEQDYLEEKNERETLPKKIINLNDKLDRAFKNV